MTRASKQLIALAVATVLLPSVSFGQDTASDEQQIRELEQQWSDAVAERDIDAVVELYAEDGRIMPPNAEAAVGHDAVRAVWSGIMELPELSFSFEPTTVEVAESGDIAYAIGTYQLMYEGDQGEVSDAGKYIDIWAKTDGEWKVVADIFNSNLPAQ